MAGEIEHHEQFHGFPPQGAERSGGNIPPPHVSNPIYQPPLCLSRVSLDSKIGIIEGFDSSSTTSDLRLTSTSKNAVSHGPISFDRRSGRNVPIALDVHRTPDRRCPS